VFDHPASRVFSIKRARLDDSCLALSLLLQPAQGGIVTRRIFAWTLFTASLATLGAIPGNARDVVEIRLQGRYFIEPATVRILVAVEPDAENRALRIEADGDSMYRSSELTLSGADEKRLHNVEFRNLPAGNYTLRAEVRSTSEVRGSASQALVVTGSGAQ
jgi:hypothetical protein